MQKSLMRLLGGAALLTPAAIL
ncbi:MAG: hypothetical protein JWN59_1415, partial [Sphingomonas bacterium]|nr:hypothetical protein [Sphingomonas bacterium]